MHTGLAENSSVGSREFNLVDELVTRHLREGRGTRPALVFEGREISYLELSTRVAQTRKLLASHGVGRGDRVGLILPDTPAYVYVLLASMSLGAIGVPINPKQNSSDARSMLEHVGAKVTLCHESLAAPAANWVPVGSALERELDPLAATRWREIVSELTCGTDPVYLLFSSGTTGAPKAIIRRHADNLHVNAAFGKDILGMHSCDRVLAVSKLTFGYALVGSLMGALLSGGSAILLSETSTAESILATIRRDQPSILLAQPRMLSEIAELVSESSEVASLRHVVSAGDVLTESVRERWEVKTARPVIDGFGSTEVGHIFISRTTDEGGPDCSGRPLRGFELKIVDAEGNEVADGTPGRLCVRGPSVSPGYWNDPERTRSSFGGGWFFSDDIFTRRNGGYYYSGRWDEVIKTGCGEWVPPHKLENILLSDPAVRDCAVVGAHDARNILRVKAFVVRSDTDETDAALCERLKHRVQEQWPQLDHMRVHMLELIPSIPRSVNGKVQRQQLAPKSLSDYAYEC